MTYYKTICPSTELAAKAHHCCLVMIIGPGAGLLVYTAPDTWRDAPPALQRRRVDLQDTAAQAGHHPAPLQLSKMEQFYAVFLHEAALDVGGMYQHSTGTVAGPVTWDVIVWRGKPVKQEDQGGGHLGVPKNVSSVHLSGDDKLLRNDCCKCSIHLCRNCTVPHNCTEQKCSKQHKT